MKNIVLRTFCHAATLASMLSMPLGAEAQAPPDALAPLEAKITVVHPEGSQYITASIDDGAAIRAVVLESADLADIELEPVKGGYLAFVKDQYFGHVALDPNSDQLTIYDDSNAIVFKGSLHAEDSLLREGQGERSATALFTLGFLITVAIIVLTTTDEADAPAPHI